MRMPQRLIVLLDTDQGLLYIYDDGIGFTKHSFSGIATLGAGNKRDIPYSQGHRHDLGSYGYGLKSTLNVASKVEIVSHSENERLLATINWNQLDEALKPDFEGFPCSATKEAGSLTAFREAHNKLRRGESFYPFAACSTRAE